MYPTIYKKAFLVLAVFASWSLAVPDFPQCLDHLKDQAALNTPVNASQDITSSVLATWGLRTFDGKVPLDPYDAVAIDYRTCVNFCGSTQPAFKWTTFSQQFSSWLLPWLALISQLPFGSTSKLDNLISVVLTVGSPTLAAYSLALTVINTRWVFSKFDLINYPNHRTAAVILDRLQQIPLEINPENGLLTSLVRLRQNDAWWNTLLERVDCGRGWSIATISTIAWVTIAYIFTSVDSFMKLQQNLGFSGQSIGCLWLWLLPLVIGWLLVPVCNREKLAKAMDKTNEIAYGTNHEQQGGDKVHEPFLLKLISDERAISLGARRESVYSHEEKGNAIFNYARVWGWARAVEEVADEFQDAFESSRRRPMLGRLATESKDSESESFGKNSCPPSLGSDPRRQIWADGAMTRAFIASLFALILQWSSIIAAFMITYFTPTTGLGCRSGSFLLYGIISTIIWATLVVSSMLSHYHSTMVHSGPGPTPKGFNRVTLAKNMSIILRRASMILATLNGALVITICTLEISGGFGTCYCSSSVLGRGVEHAYKIVTRRGFTVDVMRGAWSGGISLTGVSAVLFLIFVNLMIDNPYDPPHLQ